MPLTGEAYDWCGPNYLIQRCGNYRGKLQPLPVFSTTLLSPYYNEAGIVPGALVYRKTSLIKLFQLVLSSVDRVEDERVYLITPGKHSLRLCKVNISEIYPVIASPEDFGDSPSSSLALHLPRRVSPSNLFSDFRRSTFTVRIISSPPSAPAPTLSCYYEISNLGYLFLSSRPSRVRIEKSKATQKSVCVVDNSLIAAEIRSRG